MPPESALSKTLVEAHPDFLKEAITKFVRDTMEAEVGALLGVERYEHSEDRDNYRNGYRARRWDTRVGTIDLAIPKLRKGSYMPGFLEPRRRSEQALLSVVQEAYVHGVSTRKVEDLVQAMGIDGLSRSEVSRICAALDEDVQQFRERPLKDNAYPYVWFDAKIEKVRENGRVVPVAVVVAYGVRDDGYREVLGVDVGDAETEAFWTDFLRTLVGRGLHGVLLGVSDCHQGVKNAIQRVLGGASWQRCTVHFLRNVLGRVPKHAHKLVGATIRTIFEQPTLEAAKAHLAQAVSTLSVHYPKAAEMLTKAEEDILAHMYFPSDHWPKIRSTNPLERLNKEIARRTDVVGIFPNRKSLMRLVAMILVEQSDEWQVGRRYLGLESLGQLTQEPGQEPDPKQIAAKAT
ncbi:MAG: IS256 family transposase, partial [Cyanobacteria bacterium REEB65]|nr:IS256 family transposase [Cyanobacteria bacterium REEB65]